MRRNVDNFTVSLLQRQCWISLEKMIRIRPCSINFINFYNSAVSRSSSTVKPRSWYSCTPYHVTNIHPQIGTVESVDICLGNDDRVKCGAHAFVQTGSQLWLISIVLSKSVYVYCIVISLTDNNTPTVTIWGWAKCKITRWWLKSTNMRTKA